MRIHKLSTEVVNQIAAGEVVERPASVLKELIENSIDAGADEITLEFERGGRWVRLTDNGHGIEKDDLPLALDRHATSKITDAADLWRINSFGFRGEALASIASISRLTIITRTKTSDTAWRLTSEFGIGEKLEPISGEVGTTIIIEDLFENVPARLKFLKSETAETTQIKKVLRSFGLIHHKVSFRVRQKGKLLVFWPKQESQKSRIQQILEIDDLMESKHEVDGFEAMAYFAPPNKTAGTPKNIWLFAQNRWVQDRALHAAVMESYRSLLMHGEYPYAVGFLNCHPEEIDVNIHPAKSQVRFRNPRGAFKCIQQTLRKELEAAPWLPQNSKASFESAEDLSPTEQENLSIGDYEKTQYPEKLSFDAPSMMDTLRVYAPTAAPTPDTPLEREPVNPLEESQFWASLQVLGQAHLTYIIAQSRTSLFLIDQHAAHERIAFERLMRKWKGGDVEIQAKLLPLSLDFDEDQVEALLISKEDISKLGLEIERLGPATIGVTAAPALLKDEALGLALRNLAHEITAHGDSFALEKAVTDLCATMACHSVVRAGQSMSKEEMETLLKQMDEFPLSSFCPHGRPVYIEYGYQQIEKEFGRIV